MDSGRRFVNPESVESARLAPLRKRSAKAEARLVSLYRLCGTVALLFSRLLRKNAEETFLLGFGCNRIENRSTKIVCCISFRSRIN